MFGGIDQQFLTSLGEIHDSKEFIKPHHLERKNVSLAKSSKFRDVFD